ncbi:MAG: AI-2E family transporter [Gammaproteobacteria bacterium]
MSKSLKICLLIITGCIFIAIIAIGLQNALWPLLSAFFLAYLVFPVIKRLEISGVRREVAVVSVFVVVFSLLIVGLMLLIPSLLADARQFIQSLPQNFSTAVAKLKTLAEHFGIHLDITRESARAFIQDYLRGISFSTAVKASTAIQQIASVLLGSILEIMNLFLFPLFFFFIVHDYEAIAKQVKTFIPHQWLPTFKHYTQKINQVFSGYIRGQMLVALILALLYGTGLGLSGLQFGFIIGMFTGLLNIIPYVGFAIGVASAAIIVLATTPSLMTIGIVVATFAIVQFLESFIITPKLVGNRVGLNPLTTIIALIIGGNLAGMLGMLLAIPTASLVKLILIDLTHRYAHAT